MAQVRLQFQHEVQFKREQDGSWTMFVPQENVNEAVKYLAVKSAHGLLTEKQREELALQHPFLGTRE